MDETDFWLDNLDQLFAKKNIFKILPRKNMSENEKLNRISRLCIYLIILIILFDEKNEWLSIPLIILILIILYKYYGMSSKRCASRV